MESELLESASGKQRTVTPKRYRINEIFCSLQGEGIRAGTLNHFIRFSGCNLECREETHGFDCDTEFVSGDWWTIERIKEYLAEINPDCKSVIFTGGEPLLQLDREITAILRAAGYYMAVETNGSLPIPPGVQLDWVTCSPKVAEHAIRLQYCHELKYVRGYGQGIPRPGQLAENCFHLLISPAFSGDHVDPKVLEWCIQLIHKNPRWRLSAQAHKLWQVR